MAATYDGAMIRNYKDGVDVASTSKTGSVADGPAGVSVAAGNRAYD